MKRRLLVICLAAVLSMTSIPQTALTLTAAENDVATETAAIESTVETTATENVLEEEQMVYATNTNSASVTASGVCGDNATWELTEDGVLTISGSGAMWDCDDYYSSSDVPWSEYRQNIVTVVIEEGITSIGEYAFEWCYYLTSIEIPNSVTSIGFGAFSYCYSIISIEIPAGVTSIGNAAFSNCSALESIKVNEENPNYSSMDGVLYNKEQTSLLRCPEGKTGTFTIPTSVSYIGYDAFGGCILTNIEIPSSVTDIETSAFTYCDFITSIEIPSSVSYIGSGVFNNCSSLTSIRVDEKNLNYSSVDGVLYDKEQTRLICCPGGKTGTYTIPSSVTCIREWAFSGCSSLTSVEIPNSVTSIEYGAFSGCSSLTSIKIPDSVTSIQFFTFGSCDGLTSIEIPDSVTSIGPDAFYGCRGLTIYGYEGSYAETYANENDIPFANISTPVTGISLSKTSTTLNVGANEILTVTISPANATNKDVTWTSSDTSVATVTDGVVTAVAPGTATITVKTADRNKTAMCEVTVEAVANPHAPKLVASSVKGTAGDTVTVTVDLVNNSGFAGLNAYITYSDDLTLVEVTNMITDLTFTNDSTMVWDAASDYSEDGELLKLTFSISEDAEVGKHFVKVHFVEAYTLELEDVTFATVDGSVEVIDFIYGDANGDGEINTRDIILNRRHVASKNPITGEYSVEVETGADANGDGVVNTRDIILVRRYVAGKNPVTGESSVVLGPVA